MCGDEVANEQEHAHDDMLSDRDDVGSRDLQNLNLLVDGSVEVDVVGTHTSGDTNFQIFRLIWNDVISASPCCGGAKTYLLDQVAGEITRVEGGGDEDLSLTCTS